MAMANADQQLDLSFQNRASLKQVVDEMRELWAMALPITAMNCLVFIRAAISVFFLGRLGSLELAGGALSIGFTNITGYSILVGLASGLEPICSQAYGSRNWALLYLSLHRMIFILLVTIVPIALLWANMERIMAVMGQNPDISSTAAVYCFYSIPDLLTNTLLQPLRVFLRSQRVTRPQMYCTFIAVAMHAPLNAAMAWMGVAGVALASVITNLNMVVLMAGYVYVSGGFGEWSAARKGAGTGLGIGDLEPMLRLAVPSCLGICLEWWWYEIVTILAGYLPEPKLAVAATGILIQTTSLMYTVPMALAGCVSARVGNEIGAGKAGKAKLAAMVALGCALLMGIINVIWTAILGKRWAGLFTEEESVKALVVSVMPLLGLCELGNCPQTTGCGILRGTSRPAIGARINLWAFYLVGTPVAIGLAFGLNVGFMGLWLGLLLAQATCAASVVCVVLGTNWEGQARKAKEMNKTCVGGSGGLEEIKG